MVYSIDYLCYEYVSHYLYYGYYMFIFCVYVTYLSYSVTKARVCLLFIAL